MRYILNYTFLFVICQDIMEIVEACRVMGIALESFATRCADEWAQHIKKVYRERALSEHPDSIRRNGQEPNDEQNEDWAVVTQARDTILACVRSTLELTYGTWFPYPGCREAMRLA